MKAEDNGAEVGAGAGVGAGAKDLSPTPTTAPQTQTHTDPHQRAEKRMKLESQSNEQNQNQSQDPGLGLGAPHTTKNTSASASAGQRNQKSENHKNSLENRGNDNGNGNGGVVKKGTGPTPDADVPVPVPVPVPVSVPGGNQEYIPQVNFKNLDTIYEYSDVPDQRKRFLHLQEDFKKRHGSLPLLVARAPGRVNLIGEHIDYEGYSVLPMAISLDTLVAVGMKDRGRENPAQSQEPKTSSSSAAAGSEGEGLIHVSNVSSAYEAGTFPSDPRAPVNREKHSWINYVHAAYKGVYEYSIRKIRQGKSNGSVSGSGPKDTNTNTNTNGDGAHVSEEEAVNEHQWMFKTGLNLVVDGQVPLGSGLSSSSALVCATAIGVMHAYNLSFTKQEIAEFTRECEKYVGTMSGGMDQAISIMGERGFAKQIDFNPVTAHSVPLPIGGIFVIANTVVESRKAESAAGKYNLRVVECTLASIVLGIGLNMPREEALKLKTLKDVQDKMAPGEEIVDLLQAKLHHNNYPRSEVEKIIGVKLEDLFAGQKDFLESVKFAESQGFALYNRALHVCSEAERVFSMRKLCRDQVLHDNFAKIGMLMTESHRSCKTLYNCSSPELDELVQLSIANGAYGARLTGAGWGGCIVAYVSENLKNKFIEQLYCNYYKKRLDAGQIQRHQLKNCIFPSKPSPGACLVWMNGS